MKLTVKDGVYYEKQHVVVYIELDSKTTHATEDNVSRTIQILEIKKQVIQDEIDFNLDLISKIKLATVSVPLTQAPESLEE